MAIDKSTTLETKNFKLRIPSLEDIPHIFTASRYEGFTDGMQWNPPKDKAALIEPYHNGIKAWEEGKGYNFTIEDKETADFLGRVSIRKVKGEDRWNVGFWTHPTHQQKGVMTESLKVIIAFGFERLNAKTIEAYHAIWNKSSEKVLKRNGMQFIAYVEFGFQKNGKWVAENLLAIEKVAWENFEN